MALAVEGRGNLSDGFRGRLGVRSPGLRLGDCTLSGPVARFEIRVADQKPDVSGPAAMQRLACGGGLAAERPVFVLRAELSEGLDGWRGTSVLRVADFRASGNRLSRVQGRIGFDGNANVTRGDVEIEAAGAASEAVRAARTRFAGRYAVSPRRGDLGLQGAADRGECDRRRTDARPPSPARSGARAARRSGRSARRWPMR